MALVEAEAGCWAEDVLSRVGQYSEGHLNGTRDGTRHHHILGWGMGRGKVVAKLIEDPLLVTTNCFFF